MDWRVSCIFYFEIEITINHFIFSLSPDDNCSEVYTCLLTLKGYVVFIVELTLVSQCFAFKIQTTLYIYNTCYVCI